MKQVLLLDLKDDAEAIALYRSWHKPGCPPEPVIRSIREADVTEMEIWQVGDRLVMLMDVGENFDPASKADRDATDPEIVAWEERMDVFQKRLPFAKPGEKWVAAERIFRLSDQP
ncbi:L-rhamnose mutarotase [Sphingobium lactosutens]|uniref:L-rhamnose mutarotase n=1 Tax=Sphingobium lactosutens TaxID=522773 RepID=UPI0015BD930A|nr:L-rhamnose mutarotase [Sphingobium lactosutens]NWK97669.1 L-rhamnose mutarotase [Sphingobium lactosutens]